LPNPPMSTSSQTSEISGTATIGHGDAGE
jgi:hypothetical protein